MNVHIKYLILCLVKDKEEWRARKMAQLTNCLSCKYEGLSLNTEHTHKASLDDMFATPGLMEEMWCERAIRNNESQGLTSQTL